MSTDLTTPCTRYSVLFASAPIPDTANACPMTSMVVSHTCHRVVTFTKPALRLSFSLGKFRLIFLTAKERGERTRATFSPPSCFSLYPLRPRPPPSLCYARRPPPPAPHLVCLYQQPRAETAGTKNRREHGQCPANGLPFMLGGNVPQRMFRLNMWLMAPDVVFNTVAEQVNFVRHGYKSSAGVLSHLAALFRFCPRALWWMSAGKR